MSIMRLPTGVSFAQAKKDAKKLAKTQHIILSEALDRVAKQHSRSTWAEITHQVNAHRAALPPLDTHCSTPLEHSRTAMLMVGPRDSGKVALLFAIIEQLLTQNKPVVFIADRDNLNSNHPEADLLKIAAINLISKKYPELFRLVIGNDVAEDKGFGNFMLHGAVLVIDEPGRYLFDDYEISELVHASKHTILSGYAQIELFIGASLCLAALKDGHVDGSMFFLLAVRMRSTRFIGLRMTSIEQFVL